MKVLEFATCLVAAVASQEIEVRQDKWDACETDDDCLSWKVCIPRMFRNVENGNYSNANGCNDPAVCQGTATW